MLGVLAALAYTFAAALAVNKLAAKWLTRLDPAEKIGVGGLAGLGTTGILLFFFGLIPGGFGLAAFLLPVAALAGAALGFKDFEWKVARPEGWGLACLGFVVLLALQALIGVLAPSTSLDWDSLAYHLAVPKIWLEAGQMVQVQAMHHSNFPFGADNLFLLGLQWGGESGAKAFMLSASLMGGIAAFGLLRRWSGPTAGWTGMLGVWGIPVLAWESGTAYIDGLHGLYALLAVAYACELLWPSEEDEQWPPVWLPALFLGFCLGSKFTGLQVMAALVGVILIGSAVRRKAVEGAKLATILTFGGLLLASPWLIRTTISMGNPVYPFFYSVLGGKEWNDWRAKIYSEEQASFGVGKDPLKVGHAVLGLSYQPGRYVNPRQTEGGGFPSGAIGFAALAAMAFLAASGRANAREKAMLAYSALGLITWFLLSQQSRYLGVFALPPLIAAASLAGRSKEGGLIQGVYALQAAATLTVLYLLTTSSQLPVALGRIDREEWRAAMVPFAKAIPQLHEAVPKEVARIALYDEVFGFLLDRKYIWGNPGHSTLIQHEASQSGAEYVQSLKSLGVTHVYVSPQYLPKEARERFFAALGLTEGAHYSTDERAQMENDPNLKWRWLIADAARSGDLIFQTQAGPGLLFKAAE